MFETPSEALKQCVIALGGSKKVAPLIWPDKPITQAANLLCNCIDDSRPEKLDFSQVLFIAKLARQKGLHGFMEYLCVELHYAPPTPIKIEDEADELQRQFIEASKQMSAMLSRLESIKPSLKAVA